MAKKAEILAFVNDPHSYSLRDVSDDFATIAKTARTKEVRVRLGEGEEVFAVAWVGDDLTDQELWDLAQE